LPQQLTAIRQTHPEKQIQVFFQDEARFGQQGTLTRVWAPCGSRPRAVRQTQYGYLYVIAAACPATGQAEGILAPYLNTDTINAFLREFSAAIVPGVQAVLIWDGAGYHTSGRLEVPANVSLIRLPPYSPELNPIENLWHYLRSHHWSNRKYVDYAALETAAIHAWDRVCLIPETIRSVCRAEYLDRALNS
jgi:transposase